MHSTDDSTPILLEILIPAADYSTTILLDPQVPAVHKEGSRIIHSIIQVKGRGGSAGIRNLYSYVTFSGNIRYDNRSYAVVGVMRLSYNERAVSEYILIMTSFGSYIYIYLL